MIYKRYQYWSRDGIVWTDWFKWNSDLRDKWQLKNKLLNEYKSIHLKGVLGIEILLRLSGG